MTELEVKALFEETGAILHGHFLLTSGNHSALYLEKFQVLQYPKHTARLCGALAAHFSGRVVDVVIGPVTGGIILAHEVGKNLGARALFTERENGKMTLRRGFIIRPGEKVLVVEDIVTTGGSVREVLDVVRAHGGEVTGVGVLVDRSGGKVNFGVPTRALLTLEVPVYPPGNCPLCAQKVPLTPRGRTGKH